MNCCVTDLRNKQVINQKDGDILGPVSDVEVDTCSGRVVAIIVFAGRNVWDCSDGERIFAYAGKT